MRCDKSTGLKNVKTSQSSNNVQIEKIKLLKRWYQYKVIKLFICTASMLPQFCDPSNG